MWDTWGTYVVTTDESRLKLTFRHDGKYLLVKLASPAGEYEFSGSYGADKLVIGKCDGTPTALQYQVASMIRAIPPQREFIGQEPFVVFEDYWKLRYEHYARYAAAREWPPEKDGEAKRVEEDYRNSRM
jgi:hypothetical protein